VSGGARPRAHDESGAVAVLVGILLPVLLAFVGMAVDLGHWYLTANREQKAADAAALAGAVYLPGDPAKAKAVAVDYARQNGFAADVDTVVTPAQEVNPAQLRVTIRHTVDNFFIPVIGIARTTVTRSGVAEYQGPVPMGSPANSYGNETVGAGDARWSNTYTSSSNQPGFWANVAGPRSTKGNGDAFQAAMCGGQDGCAGSTNSDYSPNGYFYSVTVPTAGTLDIQVFDPAFVNVDDHCGTNLDGATGARNGFVTDAATRYAKGDGPFCTGDQLFSGGSDGDGVPPTTTFVFRSPTNTPWDPTSAPVIDTGTCRPRQYKGFNVNLANALDAPLVGPNPYADLQEEFRRWVDVCKVTVSTPGTYWIQVRTNVAIGNPTGPGNPNLAGGGHNRYAIRAAMVDGAGQPVSTAGIKIEAAQAMGIYANAPAGTTQFYLARVPSGSGGHTLVLSFFDISDASQPGSLSIVAPPDAHTTFRSCVGSGPQTATLPTCTVSANSSFNGRWETVRVPIPDGYACDDLDPAGCWVRINYAYGNGAKVQDTTTWTASLEGDPVRLVQ
jgi:Flp pilus assembly protein TadG